ncbi:glutaredoxin family protein [Parasalinivibrio latis]|uniref:glutaredoxin family protein n=1 Tax=Parasalinivibrio latis TaxID=2952610 RepID=UPI0030E3A94D
MALVLYSTEGCHLCENAWELCQQASIADRVRIEDIAFDDKLVARYGVTIPVLSLQDPSGEVAAELGWPFDLTDLNSWLSLHGVNSNI